MDRYAQEFRDESKSDLASETTSKGHPAKSWLPGREQPIESIDGENNSAVPLRPRSREDSKGQQPAGSGEYSQDPKSGRTSSSFQEEHGSGRLSDSERPSCEDQLPYVIQPIPGKGLGMIASRQIAQGELVLAEAPLFTIDSNLDEQHQMWNIYASFQALSAEQRAEYFGLFEGYETDNYEGEASASGSNSEEGRKVINIFSTNCFGDRRPEDHQRIDFVTLKGSRINHSCTPNTTWILDRDIFKLSVRAVTDISPGTEITITYVDVMTPCSHRRDKLKHAYKFTCVCPACLFEGPHAEWATASEFRRRAMYYAKRKRASLGMQPGTESDQAIEYSIMFGCLSNEPLMVQEKYIVSLEMAKLYEHPNINRFDTSWVYWQRALQSAIICYGAESSLARECNERMKVAQDKATERFMDQVVGSG